jgi:EmrB/QacA subfamily drug resistance transporter
VSATAQRGPDAPGAEDRRAILVVMSGLMLGMLLAALLQTSLTPALPTIAGDLGALNELSWLVTSYLLTMTVATPLFGRASDLYGRKRMLQLAIIIFVVGSVFATVAGSMEALIAARALQGIGAGGLISLPMAVVADLVPPRERGRYQGYFGGVFAVASVVGPLLGGFLVEVLDWRWIFLVNVPLGIVALFVITRLLHLPVVKRDHSMDYLGALLLVIGVSALLLMAVWGGQEYPWSSPVIIGLGTVGVALTGVFLWHEARTSEPIVPLGLFRNRTVSVGSALGLIVGLAMFGAVVYLPVYLQLVKGVSPTVSGLMLLPLMTGFLLTSIASGRGISRWGRYKVFPVVGTGLVAIGMALLSGLRSDTSLLDAGLRMGLVGVGLGLVMQVIVIAVQNSVARSELGVATSTSMFFRTLGGAFGTAVFGAILTGRLAGELARTLPAGAALDPTSVTGSPQAVMALPEPVRTAVIEGFVVSLETVFIVAAAVGTIAFLLSWLLPEHRLGTRTDGEGTRAAAAERCAA